MNVDIETDTLPKAPYVVLRAFQPKLGHQIPGYLPVVVHTSLMQTEEPGRSRLLEWLFRFVTLATWDGRSKRAGIYVVWHGNTVEEIDMS